VLECQKRTIFNYRRLSIFGAALLSASSFTASQLHAQDMFQVLYAQRAFAEQQRTAASIQAYYGNRSRSNEVRYAAPPARGLSLQEIATLEAEKKERDAKKQAEYQRWLKGSWQFFQSREPAEPDEFCTAMYQSPKGMITLSGVDKSWEGGLLMFTGEDIPNPRRFGEVKVTLTQSGDPPATVKAFNRARDPSMGPLGTVVLAVPTMEAALAGMTDEQEFALSVGGREVFRMAWKDGVKAAGELRKCLRDRRS
jgi:hypothetical protein